MHARMSECVSQTQDEMKQDVILNQILYQKYVALFVGFGWKNFSTN